MSLLGRKSDENLEAGCLLKDSELYASSVHCFYYGVLQFMKDILIEKAGMDADEIDNEAGRHLKGSHNWIRSRVLKMLPQSDVRQFGKWFKFLKGLRKAADYKDVLILSRDSGQAADHSKDLIRLLNKIEL